MIANSQDVEYVSKFYKPFELMDVIQNKLLIALCIYFFLESALLNLWESLLHEVEEILASNNGDFDVKLPLHA